MTKEHGVGYEIIPIISRFLDLVAIHAANWQEGRAVAVTIGNLIANCQFLPADLKAAFPSSGMKQATSLTIAESHNAITLTITDMRGVCPRTTTLHVSMNITGRSALCAELS